MYMPTALIALTSISCVIIHIVNALNDPIVTVQERYVTLANQEMTLECDVQNAVDPIVFWVDSSGIVWDTVQPGATFGLNGQRYSYVFSGTKYNLRISNVQASDAGKYYCRVKRDANNNKADAELTVTVYQKPESVVITGSGVVTTEFPPNVVAIPYNQESAEIICTVGPATPAVSIKWFKRGELVTNGVSILPAENHADGRVSTRSSLTLLQPRRELNGIQYTCMADVASLDIPGVDLDPMNQTFNLSVHYPPSSPLIEGYREGVIRQPGDIVVLLCKVHDGNPLPTLSWLRNGIPHYLDFHTEEKTRVITSEFVLNITAEDNKAEYRCEAKNAAIENPYIASATFEVRFPPKFVTITGQDEATAGSTITLSCSSDVSNPRTSITWFLRGDIIQAKDEDTKVISSDGGFITQTNITVPLTRNDNRAEYTCRGSVQELNRVVVASVLLEVLYPPQQLLITGFNASQPVLMDTAQSMTCSSVDGNPLPDLKWYRGSDALPTEAAVERGSVRTLDLLFIAKPSDNGAVFSCNATNKATIVPMSVNKTVTVHFPPQDVRIDVPATIGAGKEVTIQCYSGTSNPKSVITWMKDEEDVSTGQVTEVRIDDAAYGGKETISSYTFVPTAQDNGMMLHCNARNHLIEQSTTGGITLDVQHKPFFDGVVPEVALLEGANATANFTAVSNPPVTKYEWFKVDGSIETKLTFDGKRDGSALDISAVDGILYLTHLNRAKAGSYRVKASNAEGVQGHDFTINVKYGAGIKSTSQAYDDATSTLKLLCVVDSNPVNEAMMKWTRLEYDFSKTATEISGIGNERTVTLTIPNVQRDDIAKFTCEANNTLGSNNQEYAVNPVKFPPVIDKTPSTSKAAATTREDGHITCNIYSFPEPKVSWFKGATPISTPSDKYTQEISTEGSIKFGFKLTVKNVSDKDYGVYKCEVSNDKGVDSHSVLLNGTSKPDPPYDIIMLNVTDRSLNVSWTPGFNGGLTQKFKIRYQSTELLKQKGNYMYADANEPPFLLNGLTPDTEYILTIAGNNSLGLSDYQPSALTVNTDVYNESYNTAAPVTAKGMQNENTMLIVILCLTIVGVLLFILTAVLIFIFVRRRKRQKMSEATDSASQSNTVEMYGTHDGYFHDDAKSYSTYEKGTVFDDDYAKHYEDDTDAVKPSWGTYLTEDPTPVIQPPPVLNGQPNGHPGQPWSKIEDPQGTYGAYVRRPTPNGKNDEEVYADELRNLSRNNRNMQPQDSPRRPAFVAGRPAPPPPPGQPRGDFIPPSVPERKYSPVVDYGYSPQAQAGMFHASYGRSTPSVESTDDMRGQLV